MANESISQQVRDELISQDVRYRRADAGVRKEIDARISRLGRDLKNLMLTIDVAGTQRAPARQRRLKKLEKESGILIRTAYSELNGMLKASLRRVAKVEANKTNAIIKDKLP